MAGACLVPTLLLVVPLFTLEAGRRARAGWCGGGVARARRARAPRLGSAACGTRATRRQLGRPRRVRQPRHRQRGMAIAVRIGAIPRQIRRIAMVAVVARRPRRRLDRTAVLALRRLRLLRLRVLALSLCRLLALPLRPHLLPHPPQLPPYPPHP